MYCACFSTSQPLPKRRDGNRCHRNRRRGNSLTLYHAAVTNSRLRQNAKKTFFWDKTSAPASEAGEGSESEARKNSLDILLDSCTEDPSATVDEQLLAAKNIDDSLDILLDAALVPVRSVDSGCSSCHSEVASGAVLIPDAMSHSPSVNLMTSAQSTHTMSTSSSFNDFRPNCFSSDGTPVYRFRFSCFL